MTKKELIPQLTMLASRYADERLGDNNKLFASNQGLREDNQEWEQKYHLAIAANKKLEEQSEGLQVEKQALLDVVSEWKNENHSLTALNATLSEEPNMLRRDNQVLLKTVQNWQRDYTQALREKDILVNEMEALSAALAAGKETVEDLQRRYEEAYEAENHWFGEFKKIAIHCEKLKAELTEEKESHEDLKKRSSGILATMGENLQKKQEQIEALTVWKEGAENTIHELSENLHALKQINSFQEHRIEVLARKANKKAKKEQND